MNILEHIKHKNVLVELSAGGVDVSITTVVLTMLTAAALVFFFFYLLSRRARLVPAPLQSVAEFIIEFIRREMLAPLGGEAERWLPFLVTIFTFILTCNLLGLVPGFATPTSNINVTATLAIMIFVITQVVGVMKRGLAGYVRSLVPEGVPLFVTLMLFPVEIVGQLARPFSLSIRLFANLLAGHAVILVLISLIFAFKSFAVIPLSILGSVAISMFEIFVALIQAFIFTYLSASYIIGALQSEH